MAAMSGPILFIGHDDDVTEAATPRRPGRKLFPPWM
jgi:hypothetical protein